MSTETPTTPRQQLAALAKTLRIATGARFREMKQKPQANDSQSHGRTIAAASASNAN